MMRKFLIIMTILFAQFSGIACAQRLEEDKLEIVNTDSSRWIRMMNAIIKVESNGNPQAVGGNSVGIFQITPVCVRECNNILKSRKSPKRYSLRDRYNVKKSKEMFNIIQSKYNPNHDIERAIRLWLA